MSSCKARIVAISPLNRMEIESFQAQLQEILEYKGSISLQVDYLPKLIVIEGPIVTEILKTHTSLTF